MKCDTGTKLERPFLLVGRIDRFHSVARPGIMTLALSADDRSHIVKRVIHGEAGEAVALKTLIGLAQRARNIGRGHADAQNGFGARASCGSAAMAVTARMASAAARLFPEFCSTHRSNFLIDFSVTNSYANICNGRANGSNHSPDCDCAWSKSLRRCA
jgi:hypothetical protein